MINNIKSFYITKIIFSFQSEKYKLKLVKYDKSLQKKIDINLINYKIFSGRFIEYETKNIGEEYDAYSNKLIFRGEYLNGERNGKGKEFYDNCKKKFEGEFFKGKKNGKGKEFYNNGKPRFEGEYLNGIKINGKLFDISGKNIYDYNKNGFMKEYYDSGELLFEGEYLNGERNGKGKEYDIEGDLIFEGEYLNGERNGNGK